MASTTPTLFKLLLQKRGSGREDALVCRHRFSSDVEGDILEVVVDEEAAKEFCVRLSPHCSRCQHLVFQEQLSNLISEGPIYTAFSIKGARITDSPTVEQVFNQVQMTTEASIVERGGVPTISDVQFHFLLLCQVPVLERFRRI